MIDIITKGRASIEARQQAEKSEIRAREIAEMNALDNVFSKWREEHASEIAGLEPVIIRNNGYWYIMLWDNDPGVVTEINTFKVSGQYKLLCWCEDNGDLVQYIKEPRIADPRNLAEVIAEAAAMTPTRERAEQEARERMQEKREDDKRGWCPFTKERCDGQACQLWTGDNCSFSIIAQAVGRVVK